MPPPLESAIPGPSQWMQCNFYGKVLVEPTAVEHTTEGSRAMTQRVAAACRAEGLTDTIVAVEMTGIYHKPAQRAFRKAGFETRIVHPFASNHYRQPLHPDAKTDDHDLEAIFHAAVKGYGLTILPVGEDFQSLQAVARQRVTNPPTQNQRHSHELPPFVLDCWFQSCGTFLEWFPPGMAAAAA